MIQNSTNIPDQLIGIAMALALKELEVPPPREVVVKNKKRGNIKGQWGWYFRSDQRVVLIVPRTLTLFRERMKYTKQVLELRSRADFVVAVMSHELRHHWQTFNWNTEKSRWKLGYTPEAILAKEVDAEMFEVKMMGIWRKLTDEVPALKAASQS